MKKLDEASKKRKNGNIKILKDRVGFVVHG